MRKNPLAIVVFALLLSHLPNIAFAGRTVSLDAFRPPFSNNHRRFSDPVPGADQDYTNDNVTMVSGFEVSIYLRNISGLRQSGKYKLATNTATASTNWIHVTPPPTVRTASPSNWFSYVCGAGSGATAATINGSGTYPNWPAAQSFSVDPGASVILKAGVMYYKTLAANDGFFYSTGTFTPAITIDIEEDRGALIAYAIAFNRGYHPVDYKTCAGGISGVPAYPYISEWGLDPGDAREVNGGRPF